MISFILRCKRIVIVAILPAIVSGRTNGAPSRVGGSGSGPPLPFGADGRDGAFDFFKGLLVALAVSAFAYAAIARIALSGG